MYVSSFVYGRGLLWLQFFWQIDMGKEDGIRLQRWGRGVCRDIERRCFQWCDFVEVGLGVYKNSRRQSWNQDLDCFLLVVGLCCLSFIEVGWWYQGFCRYLELWVWILLGGQFLDNSVFVERWFEVLGFCFCFVNLVKLFVSGIF